MVQRVLAGVGLLAEQPGLGRPGRVPGTRELLVPKTRYIAPYRGCDDTVEILRVFHTSRPPPDRGSAMAMTLQQARTRPLHAGAASHPPPVFGRHAIALLHLQAVPG